MGGASYRESVRAKWFCCAFKVSLVFKSNLKLTLSIILKERDYMSQSMLWWSVDV